MTYKVKVKYKMVDVLRQRDGATLAWSYEKSDGLWQISRPMSPEDLVDLGTFLASLNVKALIEKGDEFLSPAPSFPLT